MECRILLFLVALSGCVDETAYLRISDGNYFSDENADPFDLGRVAVGKTIEKTFTVMNRSGIVARDIDEGDTPLAPPFEYKDGKYPGTGGTCGREIQPRESCSVIVSFRPRTAEVSTDYIRLWYADGTGGRRGSTAQVKAEGI